MTNPQGGAARALSAASSASGQTVLASAKTSAPMGMLFCDHYRRMAQSIRFSVFHDEFAPRDQSADGIDMLARASLVPRSNGRD